MAIALEVDSPDFFADPGRGSEVELSQLDWTMKSATSAFEIQATKELLLRAKQASVIITLLDLVHDAS
jgi:hypothetical protein